MSAPKAERPIARLNAWLQTATKMTGLTERDVLDRLLEDEKKRVAVGKRTNVHQWFVFAWANDQRLNLVFNGAIAS